MSKTTIFICVLCIALACRGGVFGSDMLTHRNPRDYSVLADMLAGYQSLPVIATRELGVRELKGHNDGKRVEEYLAFVGLKKGEPWCAAFVSWVHGQAGLALPKTGWSPSLFPTARLVKAAAPGNVFGIYFPALKRVGHCGLVIGVSDSWVTTIEGNTNASGGRDGDGVYQRLRHKKGIRSYSDWK